MKIYVDMDGVLTSFETAVQALEPEAALGLNDNATESQKQVMYDAIEKCGTKFWSTMPWTKDGKQLWNLVLPLNPTLLTSPGLFTYAKAGKKLWVKRNIPGTSIFFSDEKFEFIDNYTQSILIDDNKNNITAWIDAGGIGILHTSFENTEKELLELVWGSTPDITDQLV